MKRFLIAPLAALAMLAASAVSAHHAEFDALGFDVIEVQHAADLAPDMPDISVMEAKAIAPAPDVPLFVAHAAGMKQNPGTPASLTLSSLHSVIPDPALSGGDGYHMRI